MHDQTTHLPDHTVMKALGHPLRLQILHALGDQPRTVSRLADEMQLAPSKVLFHLRVLTKAGLIKVGETRQRGKVMEKHYELISHHIQVPSAELQHPGARHQLQTIAQEYLTSAFTAVERWAPATDRPPMTLRMGEFQNGPSGLAELDTMIARLQEEREKLAHLPPGAGYRFLVALYPMESEVDRP